MKKARGSKGKGSEGGGRHDGSQIQNSNKQSHSFSQCEKNKKMWMGGKGGKTEPQ